MNKEILVKKKVAIVTILGLEQEACNSIASTADQKIVASLFKGRRSNWTIVLLKDLIQPSICHLPHLIPASCIWHNLLVKKHFILLEETERNCKSAAQAYKTFLVRK
jgi:hypothetical protein